jgi:methanesulfonate monooxygenase small subunit
MSADNDAVRELIARACVALNAEDYSRFLSLCSPDFQYRLLAHSPEIRSDMEWMKYDRGGLTALFGDLPTHLHVPLGSFFRHVSVYSIERPEGADKATVHSSVLIVHTDLDGVSKLFAAAQYFDVVSLAGERPVLVSRITRLETRDIGVGTPIPL